MRYTKKIFKFLSYWKKRKFEGVSTRKDVWTYMGISRQTFYDRIKDHNWSNIDRLILSELFSFNPLISGEELTIELNRFIDSQKEKKRAFYWSRKQMASHLGISLALLYKRFKKHNWTDNEIQKIKEL